MRHIRKYFFSHLLHPHSIHIRKNKLDTKKMTGIFELEMGSCAWDNFWVRWEMIGVKGEFLETGGK